MKTVIRLQFDIDQQMFVEEAASAMSSVNSESASSILGSVAKEHFLKCIDELILQKAALRYQQVRGIAASSSDPRSLTELTSAPHSIGPFDVTICQHRLDDRPIIVPVPPDTLGLAREGDFFQEGKDWFLNTIHHMGGHAYPYRSQVTRTKMLKTIVKTRLQLSTYYIPEQISNLVLQSFSSPCACEPCYLMPYIPGVWHWIVRFICRICGKTYFCSCFREAFQKLKKKQNKPDLYFVDEDLPDVSNDALFKDNLCHLCRRAPSDLLYCSLMYGNSLQVRYGPYIVKTALTLKNGNPEDEVRLRLGIPSGLRWVSEFELFSIVKELLSDYVVHYQARPSWLGKQSLDIFIPSLKLAIEYQGRQHYEPVDFFGGEDGLQATIARDEVKAELCRENQVSLIYFRYTDKITKQSVKKKLAQLLDAK